LSAAAEGVDGRVKHGYDEFCRPPDHSLRGAGLRIPAADLVDGVGGDADVDVAVAVARQEWVAAVGVAGAARKVAAELAVIARRFSV
jgi:hypothetical protein